jgi:hypothetical protein
VTLGGGGLFVADAAAPTPAPASIVTVSPCRLVDTRETGSPLSASSTVTFVARGACSIAADATAVVLNVTVVNPSRSGFLTAFASDLPRPATSSLNWDTGTVALSNQATVGLSADGKFSVYNNAGDAELVIDVNAYFLPVAAGAEADTGSTGATGATGAQGIPGATGDAGLQGIPGIQGEPGTNGTNGARGIQGIPGVKGDKGDPGVQGPAGTLAYTYTQLSDATQSYMFINLDPSLEFVIDCDTMNAPNVGLYIHVWNGDTNPLTALNQQTGNSQMLNLYDSLTIDSKMATAADQISTTRTTLTKNGVIWEVTIHVFLDSTAGQCNTYTNVTVVNPPA